MENREAGPVLDLLLVGGGLANGLLAWRLLMTRPDVTFALVEAGASLGGNHTWSFHGTDVTPAQLEWLWVLVSKSWPSHDVAVGPPRRIGGGYHSIRSEDFHWKLSEQLRDRLRLRTRAEVVSATEVRLSTGEVLRARAVIDGRGFSPATQWPCGYQKFLGLDLELAAPHGLEVPLLMDTRVEQLGAFRFMYLLPWDDRRVLVEDTSYADDAHLDLPALRERVRRYVGALGFRIARELREEAAALPIPLSGEVAAHEVPTVGVAAGFFHATTGYSLPVAATIAEELAATPSFDAPTLARHLDQRAREHWSDQGFFRLLNRMLFRGAAPEERVRVFESFYRHDDGVIARFYAGQLTAWDKLKVLARGAPTVPGPRAIRAAFGRSARP